MPAGVSCRPPFENSGRRHRTGDGPDERSVPRHRLSTDPYTGPAGIAVRPMAVPLEVALRATDTRAMSTISVNIEMYI
jgi:hypothetical protein